MNYQDMGVVVTGGAHGIGKQICLDFLNAGAKVCFIDIDKELGNTFEAEHNNLYFYHGDVAIKDELLKFVDFSKEKMGSVSILINNACRGLKGILSDCSYDEFDEVLSIGLKAPYELSRLLREDLIHNQGSIINIASSRAFQSEPDSEAYASAKGGIVALTHALSASLANKVRVNCVAPGWIDVEDTIDFSEEDKASIPVGRVGKPNDISQIILFLCSTSSSFISGETFVVDGGMSKRMIYHDEWNWSYKKGE